MARPTILNDQLIQNFCLKLRLSGSIETAIAQTGCGHATFYRWMGRVRRGIGTELERRFIEAIDASQAEIKMRVEYALSKFFDKKWRSLAWWLERKSLQSTGGNVPCRHRIHVRGSSTCSTAFFCIAAPEAKNKS